tara:strand:- start:33035 stop:33916 length:882 start_codon:yes stop_codon:yes gene_type:complete
VSEDLEAGAAPAESGEAAPVEAAAVETAPTETEESAPVESAEPAVPSLAAEETVVEEAPVSFPSHEDFGWDDWDGSIDVLPEQMHGWGAQFDAYYQKQIESATQDSESTRELYEALMGGKEDPRLAELRDNVSEWEKKYEALQGDHEVTTREFDEYQRVVQEAVEQEAQEYATEFAESNPDLFDNEELAEVFADLLEDGWILEHAAVAARLPQEILEVAKQAKADGVPDSYALKLAQGAKSKPAKPRPGAALTAGATTPARSSEQAEIAGSVPMSLREFRKQVARNALSSKRR